MIIDGMTATDRIEYLENLLKVAQTTLESVTEQRDEAVNNYETAVLRVHYIAEQRDKLAEVIRKHRDELKLTSGDSVDRILWNVLDAVKGGSDDH